MLITILKSLDEEPLVFKIFAKDIKDVINYLKYLKGKDYVSEIMNNEYAYMLGRDEESLECVVLTDKVIFTPFENYTQLVIFKKIEGELPLAALAASMAISSLTSSAIMIGVPMLVGGAMGLTGASFIIVSSILNAAVLVGSLAAQIYVSQALSPHTTIGVTEAATISTSNLFGGSVFTLEQGGVVPLLYGHAYAKGTLICSSVTTMQG
jgi:hypothetical protein